MTTTPKPQPELLTRPFVTPVNEHGIPVRLQMPEPTGKETFFLTNKEDFTHDYWNLRSVSFEYSYAINGAVFTKSFTAYANLEPFQRSFEGPVFTHNSHNEETQTQCFFPFNIASFDAKRGYGLLLDITERETDTEFVFTTRPQPHTRLFLKATKTVPIYGRKVTFYLYVRKANWSAAIGKISHFRTYWKPIPKPVLTEATIEKIANLVEVLEVFPHVELVKTALELIYGQDPITGELLSRPDILEEFFWEHINPIAILRRNKKAYKALEKLFGRTRFHKISSEENKLRRAEFKKIRPDFIEYFASTDLAKKLFTKKEIEYMLKRKKLPKGWVVHHKEPIFRDGHNKYDNFEVMTAEYHQKHFGDLHYYE